MIYVAGSLKSWRPPHIANLLREHGHEVFDDWHAGGPDADRTWREYEQARGRTFRQALRCPFATHAFEFDKHWLDLASAFVLVTPAGKSAHMELMYVQARGALGIIYMDEEPEEWDLMYRFAHQIVVGENELLELLSHTEERA